MSNFASHSSHFTPKKSTPNWTGGCIRLTASLDAWRREKYLVPGGNLTMIHGHPIHRLVNYIMLTMLHFFYPSDWINLLIFYRMCALTSAYLPLGSDDRTHTCSRKTLPRKAKARRAANNHLDMVYGVTSSSSFWYICNVWTIKCLLKQISYILSLLTLSPESSAGVHRGDEVVFNIHGHFNT